jgi:hypothetical protein
VRREEIRQQRKIGIASAELAIAVHEREAWVRARGRARVCA